MARVPDNVIGPLLSRCVFPPPSTEVVCGVSGGADSLALLVLAAAAELRVTAVHVDHGLRPESAREAAVVADVATQVGATFRRETVRVADGPNLEARARRARLDALGPHALLGHTADDRAETILINLGRGAGPTGLAAMEYATHPLLDLRRFETHELCRRLGLRVVDDPSNDDRRFVRNRIRHELLPLWSQIAGRDLVPLLVRTADLTRDLVDGVGRLAADLDPTDTRALASAPQLLAHAALREWLRDGEGHPPSAAELARVWEVVQHRAVSCQLTGRRTVARTGGRLRLESGAEAGAGGAPGSVR